MTTELEKWRKNLALERKRREAAQQVLTKSREEIEKAQERLRQAENEVRRAERKVKMLEDAHNDRERARRLLRLGTLLESHIGEIVEPDFFDMYCQAYHEQLQDFILDKINQEN